MSLAIILLRTTQIWKTTCWCSLSSGLHRSAIRYCWLVCLRLDRLSSASREMRRIFGLRWLVWRSQSTSSASSSNKYSPPVMAFGSSITSLIHSLLKARPQTTLAPKSAHKPTNKLLLLLHYRSMPWIQTALIWSSFSSSMRLSLERWLSFSAWVCFFVVRASRNT